MAGFLSDRHCHLFSTKLFTLVSHKIGILSLGRYPSLISLSGEGYGGLSCVRNSDSVPRIAIADSGARATISTHDWGTSKA